jgi:hypothetical protein
LSRRFYDQPEIDIGDDIEFLNAIECEPDLTLNESKVKRKQKTYEVIHFDHASLASVDATVQKNRTRKIANTGQESALGQVNAITQTNQNSDILLGGKYNLPALQEVDEDFRDIIAYLKHGNLHGNLPPDDGQARKIVFQAEHYSWTNEKGLMRMWVSRSKNLHILSPIKELICIPRVLRTELMESLHDRTLIHTGQTKLLLTIQERYYWATCQVDVRDWVKTCLVCQATKPYPQHARLQNFPVSSINEICSVDIFGYLPETPQWIQIRFGSS